MPSFPKIRKKKIMKYNFKFSGVSFNSGQKDLVIIVEKEVELVAYKKF